MVDFTFVYRLADVNSNCYNNNYKTKKKFKT